MSKFLQYTVGKMSKKKRKASYRMSPLHAYEFSPMGRATRTKNNKREASKRACRGNKAGKFKDGWKDYY